MSDLKAPFPWFGGKSKVSEVVWSRFGDVNHYVEPFFGSGAVLLRRPDNHNHRLATVNDIDGYVANFWRAVSKDPDAVAHHADWPVSEVDLQARALYLANFRAPLEALLRGDADYYDAKIAGWWVWGVCSSIGANFTSNGPWGAVDGVFQKSEEGGGVLRCRPHIGDGGHGINRKMPHVGDAGRGINRRMPHVGDAGRERLEFIKSWFSAIKDALRETRVLSGDWTRAVGSNSVLFPCGGMTAVFFDPPYKTETRATVYAHDSTNIDLTPWLVEHQDNPKLRIAVCGYDGEYDLPGWECVKWKSHGGFSNRNKGNNNASRERIWFSPSCLTGDVDALLWLL